jgi:hypothetical protein
VPGIGKLMILRLTLTVFLLTPSLALAGWLIAAPNTGAPGIVLLTNDAGTELLTNDVGTELLYPQ